MNEITLTKNWAAANLTDYDLEVTCNGGRADIVSHCKLLVIEAKFAKDWRTALGQIQGYCAFDFSGYRPAVLLFGDRCSKIDETFSRIGIQLFWSEDLRASPIAAKEARLKHRRVYVAKTTISCSVPVATRALLESKSKVYNMTMSDLVDKLIVEAFSPKKQHAKTKLDLARALQATETQAEVSIKFAEQEAERAISLARQEAKRTVDLAKQEADRAVSLAEREYSRLLLLLESETELNDRVAEA